MLDLQLLDFMKGNESGRAHHTTVGPAWSLNCFSTSSTRLAGQGLDCEQDLSRRLL